VLDRKKFIDIVKLECKKFRPFGKFVSEFKRQVVEQQPFSLFG
jgi:hypothetical protein